MGNLNSWICDGIPKNGLEYPQGKGKHTPCENFTPICPICGLPQEALEIPAPSPYTGKTKINTTVENQTDATYVSSPPDATYVSSSPDATYVSSSPDATRVSSSPDATRVATQNYSNTDVPPPPFLDSDKTNISGENDQENQQKKNSNNILNMALGVGIGVIISAIFGVVGYQLLSQDDNNNGDNNTEIVTNPNNAEIISLESQLPQLISQGEKIFFQSAEKKQQASEAFTQKNWTEVISLLSQYLETNPTDPEAKIYRQNAKANENGNPLTIAVAVEVTSDNSALEILRGVASYQEDFNKTRLSPEDRLLEVVIIDISDYNQGEALAQEMIRANKILGVMGYGLDLGSRRALDKYNDSDLVVLSPLTTSVTAENNISILKVISPQEKSNQLLGEYLASVSKTLLSYADSINSPPQVMLFYHSDNSYGMQLREKIIDALPDFEGKLVKEIDLKTNDNPEDALNDPQDTNAIFLALGQNELTPAINILKVNNYFLTAMGSDELFHPDTLTQGKEGVDQLVLAVPWSFDPDDEFAQEAQKNWRGRVSWRTATAYDTTKALAYAVASDPQRPSIAKAFADGLRLPDTTTNFSVFSQVPLVQVVPGNSGPAGAGFQFESVTSYTNSLK